MKNKLRWFYKGIKLTENLQTGAVSFAINNEFYYFDNTEQAIDNINSWRR